MESTYILKYDTKQNVMGPTKCYKEELQGIKQRQRKLYQVVWGMKKEFLEKVASDMGIKDKNKLVEDIKHRKW